MRFLRHAPFDDPVTALAAGVWVAILGFVTGFVGCAVMLPGA
jgi:hypothetical protein